MLLALACACAAAQDSAPSPDETKMEQEMLRLTNQERAQRGVPALRRDEKLTEAARLHSKLMAERRKLEHQLDGEPELSARVARQGVRFNSVGENVSMTSEQPPAEQSHRGLMNSPPHRANILNGEFNSVGIAVAKTGDTYYVTEDFARSFAQASAAEAEQAVARAMNDLRKERHLAALRVVALDRLNQIACRPETDLRTLLNRFATSRGAVVFTTWQPGQLPAQMVEMSAESSVTAVSLKACEMESARGGSGGFKVAAVFF